jgi:hypothetical protein
MDKRFYRKHYYFYCSFLIKKLNVSQIILKLAFKCLLCEFYILIAFTYVEMLFFISSSSYFDALMENQEHSNLRMLVFVRCL